jgi:hypothetical protein
MQKSNPFLEGTVITGAMANTAQENKPFSFLAKLGGPEN